MTILKKTISYLFLLLLFFQQSSLFAQIDWTAITKEAYLEAAQSLVLLRNPNELIPLQRLDTLRIAVITKGLGEKNAFEEQLKSYTNISLFDDLASLPPEGFNLYIYARTDCLLSNDVDAAYLQLLGGKERLLTIVFDEEESRCNMMHVTDSSSVVYAPSSSDLHQSLAAQMIFGGTIGRLYYGPPSLVNMNGQLLADSIASIAQMGIDSGAFPGMQVLVVKEGCVIFHKTYGHHTYDQKRLVHSDDIYDLASISKVTTGLPILMQLYGQGRFDLDAPLKDYLPSFKKSNKADLKFREMLSHQARLKPWIPYWKSTIKKNGRFKWRTFKRDSSARFPFRVTDQLYLHRKYKKKIYKAICKSKLNEKSGYRYSGLLFYLLPEITERLTGQPIDRYLRSQFYDRLGATTMTYYPRRSFPLDRIVPTEHDSLFRRQLLHGKVHDEGAAMMAGLSCNAGLFASANDLAKLMQLYLNKGSYGGERYIEAKAVEEFTRCQYCDQGNRRGLGFDKPLIEYHPQNSSTARDASPASFGHSGFTGTFTWVDPDKELIFIFMSNRVYPSRDRRKIYQLNIRPRIHQLIYDAME